MDCFAALAMTGEGYRKRERQRILLFRPTMEARNPTHPPVVTVGKPR
ncbi:hypothetical protein E9232_002159 [Inquilinus ginsengisoli]|uniref:Uncharacterized protein n=1 Tax=Inquilinus ginsengisoli TaxID=363840 RepID=A0ABU1JLZ8_9PROT|nr:hypothetical protein [Inquilinus ginsengisoli]